MWCLIPFAPQGKALNLEFPLDCRLYAVPGVGFMAICVPASPALFDVFFYLAKYVVVIIQPAFRFLFRGNCSTGSSYVTILNLNRHSKRREIKQIKEKKYLKK